MDILSNLALGASVALSLQNIGYAFVGCLVGTLIGVLPGIGPVSTIAMLIPLTFHLPPASGLIMIAGISLFLRLAQAVFRPGKVLHPCPHCGLRRHDADAVHCKACGRLLTIPDEGA